jgi:hypothetical protein
MEEKEHCEKSFYNFISQSWKHIEGKDFIPSWHVSAMAEHLEALHSMQIRNLIINMPPRCGKSLVSSVIYPAYLWTLDPSLRFLYSSYAQALSAKDSVSCRRLIQCEWYQTLWGDKFSLMQDVNNKLRFDNDKNGYRIASSVGGSNTGLGGDFVICFPYDTIIRTNHGDIKIGKIVEERINCKVLSFDHDLKIFEYQDILEHMKSSTEELIEIEICDGSIFTCTPEHPIYVDGKGYVRAGDLKGGETLKSL